MSMVLSMGLVSQEELIESEGALQIGNSDDPTPDAGTIRWNGNDFEGYNGTAWVSFTQGTNYIYDIENNRYRITTIGAQTWMADNLRVTRYNDGTLIPQVLNNNMTWASLTTPAYTWYFGVDEIGNEFRGADSGALYNFYVVADTNSRNVCPVGWHVPTKAEWETLAATLGGEAVAGAKLKTTGVERWNMPNTNATNEVKFNAIPGGQRQNDGSFTDELTSAAYWWTSSLFDADPDLLCHYTAVDFLGEELIITFSTKEPGRSIRCVKD